MPATQEPPAAPTTQQSNVAAEAAKTTINVSQLPTSGEAAKPPKPGSARAKMYEEMQKKFGGETTQPPAKAADPKPAAAPKASPAEEPEKSGIKEAGEPTPPASPERPTPAEPTAATDKGKKVSPWKLVDQFKERASKAEARLLELEKLVEPEEKRKASQAEREQLETKLKEMSDELRYYNAEKYDPDVIKAKEAYTRAFNRAMSELKEVVISDPNTQQARAMTVNDLAELAFMPLGQAQAVAKEAFGDLAPYVMDHRNEIRRLWDAQNVVLEDLKKSGSEREKQRLEAAQKNSAALSEYVTKAYEKANSDAVADPKHGHLFKPRDGDTEWNSRLEKGYQLVDEAFKANVLDPRLTEQQRVEIIRKHAAIRNRAAAFGPLRYEVEALKKKLESAMAELKEFKDTTPKASGRAAEPVQAKPRGMAGLMEDLKKIAH